MFSWVGGGKREKNGVAPVLCTVGRHSPKSVPLVKLDLQAVIFPLNARQLRYPREVLPAADIAAFFPNHSHKP